MLGGTAGEVIESRNPGFAVGSKVVGYLGWQEYAVSDGTGVFKVDTRHVPLSAYLGSVGMPGVTAWYGLNRVIDPHDGQTIVVSAASGAVGSVVGQLGEASAACVRSVSPAAKRSAATSPKNSGSTPALTTNPRARRRDSASA